MCLPTLLPLRVGGRLSQCIINQVGDYVTWDLLVLRFWPVLVGQRELPIPHALQQPGLGDQGLQSARVTKTRNPATSGIVPAVIAKNHSPIVRYTMGWVDGPPFPH